MYILYSNKSYKRGSIGPIAFEYYAPNVYGIWSS